MSTVVELPAQLLSPTAGDEDGGPPGASQPPNAEVADEAAPDGQESEWTEVSPEYRRQTDMALREADELIADAAPPVPPPLPPDEQKQRLRNLAPASYLYGATAALHGPAYDVAGYAAFLDEFLREAAPRPTQLSAC